MENSFHWKNFLMDTNYLLTTPVQWSSNVLLSYWTKKFDNFFPFHFLHTVKPAYNDTPWDHKIVPFLTGVCYSVVISCNKCYAWNRRVDAQVVESDLALYLGSKLKLKQEEGLFRNSNSRNNKNMKSKESKVFYLV